MKEKRKKKNRYTIFLNSILYFKTHLINAAKKMCGDIHQAEICSR